MLQTDAASTVAKPAQAGAGLHFEGVSHAYAAERVLRDVSLTAHAGAITCLLGPSGAGKTTLLRLAAGLEPLQAGSITLDGAVLARPGKEPPPNKRSVGLVFQDLALFPHMTVAGNIGFGLRKWDAEARRARIDALLGRMGLSDLADRRPHTLSGGQAQRVALARALAPQPRVVLMDEPYASLDPGLRVALRDSARAALKESGAVTILVTHDPAEALDMADAIAVLDAGRLAQSGAPRDVHDAPKTAAVCAAFGAAQRLIGRVEGDRLIAPEATILLDPTPVASLQGRAVEAMIRPSALAVTPADNDAETPLRVRDIRFTPPGWTVLISAKDAPPDAAALRAPIADPSAVQVGQAVALRQSAPGLIMFPVR